MEEGVKVVFGKLETSSPVSLTSLWRALIAGKTAEGRGDDDDLEQRYLWDYFGIFNGAKAVLVRVLFHHADSPPTGFQ